MKRDGEWPLVGPDRKALGVIVGSTGDADIPIDEEGQVSPHTGGMSVSSAWRTLPYWRIPRRLQTLLPEATGSNLMFCWRFGEGAFESAALNSNLDLRVDRAAHGLVEPARTVPLSAFEEDLGATKELWTVDED